MKLLHTSDWHLGKKLFGQSRHNEMRQFLNWLVETIAEHHVQALLIAGDVFDASTPSHLAQTIYYRFLYRVAQTDCRHIVVIAGNHDSPSLINAPKEVLRHLNIHVLGSAATALSEEVLVLEEGHGKPELIVCAVPYLRDRDIRQAEAGESVEDKSQKILAGIRHHYTQVCALAEQKRTELDLNLPIVAMGHLFTTGGRTMEGDGVRELYVGSLARVQEDTFPKSIDYLALGHLHVPQRVGDSDIRRYSGSPLPVSFAEAGRQKIVLLADLAAGNTTVKEISVPCFQKMEILRGDLDTITTRLDVLRQQDDSVWLEVIYDGNEVIGNLHERLTELVKGSPLEILRIRNQRLVQRTLERTVANETLDDLTTEQVFVRCLEAYAVPEEQRPSLMDGFREIVEIVHETDYLEN